MRKYLFWSGDRYKDRNEPQERNAIEALSQLPDTEEPISRILDIGCGTGNVTQLLSKRFPKATIIGIDSSESMIKVAQSKFTSHEHPNLTFLTADISTFVSDQKFDLVVSFNCFHWVPNLDGVLANNICPLLKQNATLLFMMYPRAEKLWDAIDKVATVEKWREFFPDYQSPYQSYQPDEIDYMLKNNSLSQNKVNITPKKTSYSEGPQELGKYLYGFLPILDVFNEGELKKQFINDVLNEYVKNVPINEDGSLDFEFVQLNSISTFQPYLESQLISTPKQSL